MDSGSYLYLDVRHEHSCFGFIVVYSFVVSIQEKKFKKKMAVSLAVETIERSSLAHLLFHPSDEGYSESVRSYWSNQEAEVRPAGILRPRSVSDVAEAVKLLSRANLESGFAAPFAVRSGGHQTWAGSANLAGGLNIDLRELKNFQTSSDGQLVMVGAGAYWEDLYNYLEPMNLSLPGARVAQVGVSGLALGGKILS